MNQPLTSHPPRRLAAALAVFLTFLSLFSLFVLPAAATGKEELTVLPGGIPFGVKFSTEGVLIVGFCDVDTPDGPRNPARDAGLKIKDVLTHINGESLTDAAALTRAVAEGGGQTLTVSYKRSGHDGTATLTPVADTSGTYRTGLYVRDSGAGIGTVTFVVPGTHAFAGLGHGICDVDTGELMPLRRGHVMNVTVSGIHRGKPGEPGEVKGYFAPGKCGSLLGNTSCGVYGLYAAAPERLMQTEPVSLGKKEDIREGEATLYCTLGANERRGYTIRISNIDHNAKGSKCFTIQITDPALLEETGGIVQGMSGSPILQDGKLIGAVTHVLINNPAVGYGIFIENMLNAMPELLSPGH